MSLILPPRPSLDHLKKQAKDRLADLQAASPGAQLADAQHALARDYGFASWPKLKAHVEAQADSAAPAPPQAPTPAAPATNGSFSRYSHRARQALFFSRWEAAQVGSPAIEPEHLLLGLIHARQGLPVPAPLVIPLAELRAEVHALTTRAEPLPNTVMIPFSDATKLVIHRAVEEADQRQHPQIGTMHLVLGVLREPAPSGAGVMSKRGVGYTTLAGDAAAFVGDD